MAETGSWNGRVFEVTNTRVMSFEGLTIDTGAETKVKTAGKQQYVTYKAGTPANVNISVTLLAAFGVDVRAEAMGFLMDAQAGAQSYFYVGNGKLLACQLMLTEAKVDETNIAPSGEWVSAKVALTMKQASKYDGAAGSSSGSGSKKASTKLIEVKKTVDSNISERPGAKLLDAAAKSAEIKAKAFVAQVAQNFAKNARKPQTKVMMSGLTSLPADAVE